MARGALLSRGRRHREGTSQRLRQGFQQGPSEREDRERPPTSDELEERMRERGPGSSASPLLPSEVTASAWNQAMKPNL